MSNDAADRIRTYYNHFDEWARLDTPAGSLEFRIVMRILDQRLPQESRVLDLGSGPGRYSFELAERGHRVWLADLSPALVAEAQRRLKELNEDTKALVREIGVVDATDLARYPDRTFDAVLLFGPLYHLSREDAKKCIREVARTIVPGGTLFAIYMPYEVGLKSILERSFYAPDQVNLDTYADVVDHGYFRNNTSRGFQEGYFHTTADLTDLLRTEGFTVESVRSIRGVAFGFEQSFMKKEAEDPSLFERLLGLVDRTATLPSITDTCGHALVTAVRPGEGG